MARIRIDISFKGTNYHGWQFQENAFTIQEELNKALSTLFCETIETVGCGRTDTGVHAKQFTAHFDCKTSLTDAQYIKFKLNTLLSKDIVVVDIYETSPDFHARYDAIRRTYKYFIHTKKDPFIKDFSTFIFYEPDVELMNEAAKLLLGNKDFTSFSKLHTDVTNNYCTVYEAYWTRENDKLIFTISANRFLRNMVRAIVGTLLDLGRNKIAGMKEFVEIIEAKDRCKARTSVPACGLFLWENIY